MTDTGADTPVQSSNEAAPCATSTSSPSSTRAPARGCRVRRRRARVRQIDERLPRSELDEHLVAHRRRVDDEVGGRHVGGHSPRRGRRAAPVSSIQVENVVYAPSSPVPAIRYAFAGQRRADQHAQRERAGQVDEQGADRGPRAGPPFEGLVDAEPRRRADRAGRRHREPGRRAADAAPPSAAHAAAGDHARQPERDAGAEVAGSQSHVVGVEHPEHLELHGRERRQGAAEAGRQQPAQKRAALVDGRDRDAEYEGAAEVDQGRGPGPRIGGVRQPAGDGRPEHGAGDTAEAHREQLAAFSHAGRSGRSRASRRGLSPTAPAACLERR